VNNGFWVPVLIVAIVMIATVMKARYRYHHEQGRNGHSVEDRAENLRLREEVGELKERIKVLERIAVDKENSLVREIEDLRDR
jgi:hypothetical protein